MSPRIFCLIAVVGLPLLGLADSPITSTQFHEPYASHEMVRHAAETKDLDRATLNFLTHPDNPTNLKLAVVSAIGWQLDDDREISLRFMSHLAEQKGIPVDTFQAHLAKFSSEELTLYGYLYALEYFLMDDSLASVVPILRVAVAKNRESYAASLVLALVECQLLMGGDDWQLVWDRYERFSENEELKRPLIKPAEKVITDYLKLYDEN